MKPLAKFRDTANSFLEINIDLIVDNYRLLKKELRGAECAATLKADAYGIGSAQVAKALVKTGCRTFFVATIDEGIELRAHLPSEKVNIAVLGGLLARCEYVFEENNLIPVLNNLEQLRQWKTFNVGKDRKSPSMVHIDTGMNRLGLTSKEFEYVIDNPFELEGVEAKLLLSHLACADQPGHEMNQKQLYIFMNARNKMSNMRFSLSNSGGIFLGQTYHFDMARPGIALYGSHPDSTIFNPLNQVIKLYGRVLQIRDAKTGSTVGYSASHLLKKKTLVATVGLGYADGYIRSLGGNSYAFFKGAKLPIIGPISMDYITVDISNIKTDMIKIGDLIEFIGDNFTLDDIAKVANTVPHEILSNLGKRHQRSYFTSNASPT
ncbi:MAG: alanine racemase [Alphaproteobacteria bacterium]|nr:alanine racemase [Alphaproteobacteria bacterium]MDG1888636.1 alanine racemase [Alphaproteobacteria bacterium]|tara:strand:- start:706 stop:1839 length:1134 start_codon:yes stop_codon:yes gene_type:complete